MYDVFHRIAVHFFDTKGEKLLYIYILYVVYIFKVQNIVPDENFPSTLSPHSQILDECELELSDNRVDSYAHNRESRERERLCGAHIIPDCKRMSAVYCLAVQM